VQRWPSVVRGSSRELDGASLVMCVTGQTPCRSFGDLDGTSLVAGVARPAVHHSSEDLDGTSFIVGVWEAQRSSRGSLDRQRIRHLEISLVHRSSRGSRRLNARRGTGGSEGNPR
jgi:hypothetical protein